MEQSNSLPIDNSIFKLRYTYKELGVFFLLLFLNLKFVTITITHNRNIFIDIIVYLLFIVTFNYSNWTYKSFIKTILIIGVYTLINFSQYKLNVLMPLLIIQSASGIRFIRYLKINFIVTAAFLSIMYIVYGEGFNISDGLLFTERRTRMSFGFNYPNVAAINYFCFIVNGLLIVYFSEYKKRTTLYLLLIIPLWFYIYSKTLSRSFLLSIIILYAAYIYFYIGKIVNKKVIFNIASYVLISIIFIFPLITITLALQWENLKGLNRLLSNRLIFYNNFLNTLNPIDILFGSKTFENFVIDSSYIRFVFEGGLIFFLFLCFFYVLATTKMINKKDWIPICVIFSFMFYGLMESFLLYSMLIGTNIYWVTLYYYYRNGKMKL